MYIYGNLHNMNIPITDRHCWNLDSRHVTQHKATSKFKHFRFQIVNYGLIKKIMEDCIDRFSTRPTLEEMLEKIRNKILVHINLK